MIVATTPISFGLYKHRKGPPLCTNEHKEAQRTIRHILIGTNDLHMKYYVKKQKNNEKMYELYLLSL